MGRPWTEPSPDPRPNVGSRPVWPPLRRRAPPARHLVAPAAPRGHRGPARARGGERHGTAAARARLGRRVLRRAAGGAGIPLGPRGRARRRAMGAREPILAGDRDAVGRRLEVRGARRPLDRGVVRLQAEPSRPRGHQRLAPHAPPARGPAPAGRHVRLRLHGLRGRPRARARRHRVRARRGAPRALPAAHRGLRPPRLRLGARLAAPRVAARAVARRAPLELRLALRARAVRRAGLTARRAARGARRGTECRGGDPRLRRRRARGEPSPRRGGSVLVCASRAGARPPRCRWRRCRRGARALRAARGGAARRGTRRGGARRERGGGGEVRSGQSARGRGGGRGGGRRRLLVSRASLVSACEPRPRVRDHGPRAARPCPRRRRARSRRWQLCAG